MRLMYNCFYRRNSACLYRYNMLVIYFSRPTCFVVDICVCQYFAVVDIGCVVVDICVWCMLVFCCS